MSKSEKPDNLLQIARYFNEHPRDSVKNLLKFCQLNDILKSNDAVYRALRVMEQERILLNGNIVVKNHEGYKNIHYLIQTDDVDEFMNSVFQENRDSIEAVYRSRQGKEHIIYVKSTTLIDFEEFDLLEELEWESYTVIFPWEWDCTERFLITPNVMTPQESPPPQENLTAQPEFKITNDMKTLLYWYKVNVRLPDVPVMKETGFDHRKVKTLRNEILANSIIHFPTFLYGVHNYVPLYFSFSTAYYDFLTKLFARNSAVSFLIKGKKGRSCLFINTVKPAWVLRAMEEFEDTGIVRNMLSYYLQERWKPTLEDFKSGKIPEKYFWMFGTSEKK